MDYYIKHLNDYYIKHLNEYYIFKFYNNTIENNSLELSKLCKNGKIKTKLIYGKWCKFFYNEYYKYILLKNKTTFLNFKNILEKNVYNI